MGFPGRQYVAVFLRFLASSSEMQRGGGGSTPAPCSGEPWGSGVVLGGTRQSGGGPRFSRPPVHTEPLRAAVAGDDTGVAFVLPGGCETWQPGLLLFAPSPGQVRL